MILRNDGALAKHARIRTIPALAGLGGDRSGLLAALLFVEGAPDWGERELCSWFRQHFLTSSLLAKMPASVSEAFVEAIALPSKGAREDELEKLLGIARARVLATLRAFRRPSSDDRFLQSAIFAGRVERTRAAGAHEASWSARLDPTMDLSTLVLSLFAADILTHREAYDAHLCVCEVCGHVSLDAADERSRCDAHPRSQRGGSGFFKRA